MKPTVFTLVWFTFALNATACRNAGTPSTEPAAMETDPRMVAGRALLPERFNTDWARAGKEKTFILQDLYNRINGAAELFLEMGFRQLVAQHYQSGEVTLELEIYQMEDPTAALGIYFHKRGNETPVYGLTGRHTGNRFQITACKGKYFIQINNFSGNERRLPAMVELTRSVLNAVPEDETVELLALLPQRELLPGSELIFRGPFSLQSLYSFGEGDVLQLRGKVFGIAGDYLTDGECATTRLFIPYGDRAAATAAYRHLVRHLDPHMTVIGQNEQRLVFRDFKGECGVVKLDDNRLEAEVHLPCSRASLSP